MYIIDTSILYIICILVYIYIFIYILENQRTTKFQLCRRPTLSGYVLRSATTSLFFFRSVPYMVPLFPSTINNHRLPLFDIILKEVRVFSFKRFSDVFAVDVFLFPFYLYCSGGVYTANWTHHRIVHGCCSLSTGTITYVIFFNSALLIYIDIDNQYAYAFSTSEAQRKDYFLVY